MDSEDDLHWLLLARLPGCTASTLRKLIARYDDPRELLHAAESDWLAAGANHEVLRQRRAVIANDGHPLWQQADSDRHTLGALNAGLLPLASALYPPLLRQIYDPPPLLYYRGDLCWLQQPALAIVGSRNATANGSRAAREIAADLVRAGFLVCSGLALGIDASAHRGALQAGGATIAVMATGVDRVYPRRHDRLATDIEQQGLLLTEFPPGSPPRREAFPQRNRLVSGLCAGVLVIEAALRSGSLITARTALEQNREVFALPHSIYDPGGRGCHALIREGAMLVEGAIDQLGSLCVAHRLHCPAQDSGDSIVPAQWRELMNRVGYAPVSVDELALQLEWPVSATMSGLVELELLGLLENRDGLYMRK